MTAFQRVKFNSELLHERSKGSRRKHQRRLEAMFTQGDLISTQVVGNRDGQF